MKKFIVTLLLVAGIGYGGSTYYLHQQVKNFVSDTNTKLAGAATIEYGEITSNIIEKKIGLKRVNVHNVLTGDDIYIAQVDIIMPDHKTLLMYEQPNSLKQLPKTFQINFTRMEFGLASRMFDSAVPVKNDQGCSIDEPNWIVQVKRMGHSVLTIDSRIKLSFNPDYDRLSVGAYISARNLQTIDANITYDIGSGPVHSPLAVFGAPRIASLSFEIYDDNLTKSLINECTKKTGLKKSAIINKHIKKIEKMMLASLNLKLDDSMKEQLRNYYDQPGHLKISAEPAEPVELLSMSHYKASDVPDLLNLSIESSNR